MCRFVKSVDPPCGSLLSPVTFASPYDAHGIPPASGESDFEDRSDSPLNGERHVSGFATYANHLLRSSPRGRHVVDWRHSRSFRRPSAHVQLTGCTGEVARAAHRPWPRPVPVRPTERSTGSVACELPTGKTQATSAGVDKRRRLCRLPIRIKAPTPWCRDRSTGRAVTTPGRLCGIRGKHRGRAVHPPNRFLRAATGMRLGAHPARRAAGPGARIRVDRMCTIDDAVEDTVATPLRHPVLLRLHRPIPYRADPQRNPDEPARHGQRQTALAAA